MTKVIVMGTSGMLGSMVADVLSRDPDLSVTGTVRSQGLLGAARGRLPGVDWRLFNGTEREGLEAIDGHEWVINAIGIIKPFIHDDNANEVERAILINSVLPYLIGTRASAAGASVLQIATDCVYSGMKGNYSETDFHDALDVYGKSKSLGESMQKNLYHLRCSIIGPEPKGYQSLLEWFKRQPRDAQVNGYINHSWNGITTLSFAKICRGVIKSKIALPHLQHIVPAGSMTKARMLKEFAQAYHRQDVKVVDTEAKSVIDRTLATNNGELNSLLWKSADYDQPPTVSEMIGELGLYEYRLSELKA